MKAMVRAVIATWLVAGLIACAQPQAPQHDASVAKPDIKPSSAAPSVIDAMLACLATDRAKWLAGAPSGAPADELWGNADWIDQVKDPARQAQYRAAFDLYQSQHTVAGQVLMSAVVEQQGANAPHPARAVEALMREQYNAVFPPDSDAFDPELRAALEAAAAQLQQGRASILPIDADWRPFADLAVQGAVYSDAFAQSCALQVLRQAPAYELATTERALNGMGQSSPSTNLSVD